MWLSLKNLVFQQSLQILAIPIFGQGLGQRFQPRCINPALPVSDFFGAGNFEPLPLFNRLNELAGFEHRLMGTGIEPGVAAPHHFNGQLLLLKIDAVNVGDLEFTAVRGFDIFGDLNHLVIVEIESRHRVVGLWF